MATMNISLPDQMKAFAEAQTRDGRYSNVSDYMRDLIRRDQDRRQAIAEIQALIDEGLASGPAEPFDMKAFISGKEAEHLRKSTAADR
jgi:antitoxin ParD1/3/4